MNTNALLPRLWLLALFGVICFCIIVYRLWDLQIDEQAFLQAEGVKRSVRTVPLTAFRGMIRDRHGEPLAISTPVDSLWVDPKETDLEQPQWQQLAKLLNRHTGVLKSNIQSRKDKRFLYIKRHLPPVIAEQIERLQLKGVYLQREYKRFYPTGEVFAHVLGFTNIDHQGIQGIEQMFDRALAGKPGKYRVLKDRFGKKVEGYEYEVLPENGKDIQLSLDSRLQYLAYKSLKEAVQTHKAKAGMAVVLDVQTGEVLAMVNQPSFNPNTKINVVDSRLRNRAVTDTFEPGSVMKAISMVHILESGKYYPHTQVNTAPGWVQVSGHTVKDIRNYGLMDLNMIMQKSSNVGITKLALDLPAQAMIETFRKMGFGEKTQSAYPGESQGTVNDQSARSQIGLATLAFGYGMTATPLQLAQSYATIANHGKKNPVTFIKQDALPKSTQVIQPDVAQVIARMLQSTTQAGGTATRAAIHGYSVAGKTGTVRKVSEQGYSDNQHLSIFAGFVPVSAPEIAIVVVIDEPTQGQFYGGDVAAPVFAKIAYGAMQFLRVPFDQYRSSPTHEYILAKN